MPTPPVNLAQPPLIEAVFELRFTPTEGARELLPGMLFQSLGKHFGRVEALPFASVPREIVKQKPELQYQASVRLMGEHSALLLGDAAALLSFTPPYTWASFRALALEISEALRRTGMAQDVERFSFKCVNAVKAQKGSHSLEALNVVLGLGKLQLMDSGLRIRAEVDSAPFVSIVEISAPMDIALGSTGEKFSGTVLTIDTIRPIKSEEFWNDPGANLDDAHARLEAIFFELITERALSEMGPSWG